MNVLSSLFSLCPGSNVLSTEADDLSPRCVRSDVLLFVSRNNTRKVTAILKASSVYPASKEAHERSRNPICRLSCFIKSIFNFSPNAVMRGAE